MIIMDSVVIPRAPPLPPLPPPPMHLKAAPLPPLPPPPQLKQLIAKTTTTTTTTTNNHHHIAPSIRSKSSTTSNGFRLMEDQGDSGSVYSIYKQKIDAMFESDSSITQSQKNSVQARIEKMFSDIVTTATNHTLSQQQQLSTDGVVATSTAAATSSPTSHIFSVDYLGSIPLQEKVTSLNGLQIPLKELYFAYKRTQKQSKQLTGRLEIISNVGLKVQYQGEKGDLEQMNSFPTIAVWSAVKFVLQKKSTRSNAEFSYAFLPLITDPDNIDKRTLFRTLEESDKKFILNPDLASTSTHSPLFAVVMRKIGVHKQLECHGFVCQTSEDAIVIAATLYKSLMAHMKNKERKLNNRNGITSCMSIASSMTFNENKSNLTPVRPPRKKRNSTTSSIRSERSEILDISDTRPLIQKKTPKKSTKTRRAPKVPPSPSPQDLDAIVPYEEPDQLFKLDKNDKNHEGEDDEIVIEELEEIDQFKEIKPKKFSDHINTFMSREQKEITAEIKQVMSESINLGLKHVERPSLLNHHNNRKLNDEEKLRTKENNTGDILTKVTIPRSGSFLNAGGLTRYKSKVSRGNGAATGGSPLGFNELFNEFRLQEGLHSMDEILGVIIDPEGMSFNDLKPIYKEFLLKLSVTLTKDELYQRSKMIMRRQKKKLLRHNSSIQTKKPKHRILVGSRFKRLKHIFQKNLRLNLGHTHSGGSTAKNSPKLNAIERDGGGNGSGVGDAGKLPESSISTSSYDTRQFSPKQSDPNNGGGGGGGCSGSGNHGNNGKKQSNYKKKNGGSKSRKRDGLSTSEESDFFSIRRKSKQSYHHSNSNHSNHTTSSFLINQNRNSSSGYVSCSECSYDSDTCTCISADKCYCSLGNNNNNSNGSNGKQLLKQNDKCECQFDMTFCGCDTDSCTESNKCYCPNVGNSTTAGIKNSTKTQPILEQLKRKGLLPSHYHHGNSNNYQMKHKKLCKKMAANSNIKTTRSLEYMKNPIETYYEKLQTKLYEKKKKDTLGLDYDLFNSRRHSTAGSCIIGNSRKTLYTKTTMSECGNENGLKRLEYGSCKYQPRSSCRTVASGACTEALSVKKSAEIAALFADIKLSQTTDIAHLRHSGTVNSSTNKTGLNSSKRKQKKYDSITSLSSSMISSRNAYNKLKNYSHNNTTTNNNNNNSNSNDNNNIIAYYGSQRMIQNSLYTRNNNNNDCHNSNNSNNNNNNKLFSAKNGLYTIQSQSDESKSSGGGGGCGGGNDGHHHRHYHNSNNNNNSNNREYFEIDNNNIQFGDKTKNLENSLGYLP